MDIDRVKSLIKYALAVAGLEDPGNQELGPIHLIKYAYLGDLSYAEAHGGETFTETPWIFYHYGPWSLEVFKQIDKVVEEIGAQKRTLTSPRFENDSVRYRFRDEEFFEQLDRQLPSEITRAIRRAVHEFGNDTSSLLHYIYNTAPMRCAAPNEHLSFVAVKETPATYEIKKEVIDETTPTLSTKGKKIRKERLELLKEKINKKLQERRLQRTVSPIPAPRYDQVFFDGQKWLDELAGPPIESSKGELSISDSVWKSEARCDPDVP
jgi:hypothetical protein